MKKKIKILSKNNYEYNLSEFERVEVLKNNGDYIITINGIDVLITKEQKLDIINYINNNINKAELKYISATEDFEEIFSKLSFHEICKGYHHKYNDIYKVFNNAYDVFLQYEEYEKCDVMLKLIKKVESFINIC